MAMASTKWISQKIGGHDFEVMNLDFPEIEARVLAEMDSGVSVYYDTRWDTTTRFSDWLGENAGTFENREILAIGAGVGFETLLLAQKSAKLYINDFAPVSVELCAEQLEQNGFTNYIKLPGDFTEIPLPETADLAVACFIVYNQETRDAMLKFIERFNGEIILVNERLKAFCQFLDSCRRPHEVIFEDGAALAIRFGA
jgi:ubiquinone/menaquinone biosynthesis C-methylase UbiE